MYNVNYLTKMQQQNNPSFGMALHMDEIDIATKVGNYAAREARKARPNLEEFATDVDVFVKPKKWDSSDGDWLKILVQDLTPPNNSKNPIEKFFKEIQRQWQIKTKPHAEGSVYIANEPVYNYLIKEVKVTKGKFLNSK